LHRSRGSQHSTATWWTQDKVS